MKSLVTATLFVCATLLASCGNNEMRENFCSLLGSEVEIPCDEFEMVSYGAKAQQTNCNWTYVSYVDSAECTPCHMSSVGLWTMVKDIFTERESPVSVILIYSPKKHIVDDVRRNYRLSNCPLEVYLDTTAVFLKRNPQIPSDRNMHTMLLNSSRQVVLVGDPTQNSKVEELLCAYLDSVLVKHKD